MASATVATGAPASRPSLLCHDPATPARAPPCNTRLVACPSHPPTRPYPTLWPVLSPAPLVPARVTALVNASAPQVQGCSRRRRRGRRCVRGAQGVQRDALQRFSQRRVQPRRQLQVLARDWQVRRRLPRAAAAAALLRCAAALWRGVQRAALWGRLHCAAAAAAVALWRAATVRLPAAAAAAVRLSAAVELLRRRLRRGWRLGRGGQECVQGFPERALRARRRVPLPA